VKHLEFWYRTTFIADGQVTGQRFTLRCLPYTDELQLAGTVSISITPSDFVRTAVDQWGNPVLYGVCREEHNTLNVEISGVVSSNRSQRQRERHIYGMEPFRYPTPLTAPDANLRHFAEGINLSAAGGFEVAKVLNRAVHEHMSYCPGSTTVTTTAAQAFAKGTGVCQDYAHIMASLLRICGIPARYCAGMVTGEGYCHAWVEVLVNGYWYGFDPTAGKEVTDSYIKIAHGRDFDDCALSRGLFRGNCSHITDSRVSVTETE